MAEIKWIKINTDIFDNEKIRVIEKMPEGDTMLVIWLKLLALAGKKNHSGMVYLTSNIPYTPEILSDIFNRESRLISLALNTFVSFNMIEIENDIINVLNWDKYQNIEGMEKIRNQNKIRQANYRQRKQLENSNVTSRDSNGTDKNKKEDKEKKKSKIKEEKYNPQKDLLFFNDTDFKEVWKDYIAVRNKKKAVNSDRAIRSVVCKLKVYSDNNKEKAIEVLENSINGGWSDIYEPKNKTVEQKEDYTQEEIDSIWK